MFAHRRPVRDMLVARASRPVLPALACILCATILVACVWNARRSHRERLVHLSGQSAAVPVIMSLKYVWVGESTVPGAGLGVFASRDLPAGTPWNFEEAEEGNTLVINLPLWQSLSGLLEYTKTLGLADNPLQGLWAFFDVYGYTCDHPQACNVVGLLASSFTNHAPSSIGDKRPESTQQHGALEKNSSRPPRFANSGGDSGTAVTEQWSDWQKCTVSYTFRDLSVGEELLEDFNLYAPPCRARGDCAAFYGEQADGMEQPDKKWAHRNLAKLEHVYVGNKTGPAGVVGVFAAHDLPAGFVWNKEDTAHAWSITRKQWEQLLKLQKSLKVAGMEKPAISASVEAFRRHGYCCPLDGRLYLVFSPSILANSVLGPGGGQNPISSKQRLAFGNAASNVNGEYSHASKGADGGTREGRIANSMLVFSAEPGQTQALTVVEGCTWRQTVAAIKKGEEILETHNSKHTCNWPGFEE